MTLFEDTVKKSPGFALAQNQLAMAYWQQGRRSEALEILRQVEMPVSQEAFLNKVLILLENGNLEEARHYLLENLSKPETQSYHTVILERLVAITEQQLLASSSQEQRRRYYEELSDYLEQLWHRTGKPFYLYRLGHKQMENGDLAAARESFSRAYEKFPAESIYREPSRKLAERLQEQ